MIKSFGVRLVAASRTTRDAPIEPRIPGTQISAMIHGPRSLTIKTVCSRLHRVSQGGPTRGVCEKAMDKWFPIAKKKRGLVAMEGNDYRVAQKNVASTNEFVS